MSTCYTITDKTKYNYVEHRNKRKNTVRTAHKKEIVNLVSYTKKNCFYNCL